MTGVDNQLEAHEYAGDVPSLQGGTPRSGERSEFMQASWAPAARLLAAVAGGAMALYGMRRRGVTGAVVGLAGGVLAARAVTNLEVRDLVGVRGGRGITVRKTIHIEAPVACVYEAWSHHEATSLQWFRALIRGVR